MNKTITLTEASTGDRILLTAGQFYVDECELFGNGSAMVTIVGADDVRTVKESFDEIRDMIEGKPAKKKPVEKFDFKKELISRGADEQHVKDWFAARSKKKCVNTKTAFNGFMTEVEKSGLSVPEVVKIAANKSWGGFEAKWLPGASTNGKTNNQTPSDRQRHAADELRRKQQANSQDDSLI